MINGLKNQIDRLWTEFWTGGITNPLMVIEQISFLMFARLLDVKETREENKASHTKKEFRRIFSLEKIADETRQKLLADLVETEQDLRWSKFKHQNGPNMLRIIRDGVFPHFKTVAVDGAKFGEYMKDAQLMIQKPTLLVSAVNMIDKLPLTEGDTKGDLYEYLLSKLTTAGINGQFRTPRHIIRKMVEILDPRPDETVGDPACGTAGFLVSAMEYLQETYTSPEATIENPDGSKTFTGDQLVPYMDHIQNHMFNGFDFDVTMLRIASMNLLLHGIDAPNIHYQDTLSNSFPDRFPDFAKEHFDVILANPPFKGSLDYEDVHPSLLSKVKTKKTELLFVTLMLRMLKMGGRAAIVVPDGVLFGSSKAHVALRKMLVDKNQLEAVISLPSGVFRPYAGVSTAIIVFTKGGRTDNVFYFDVEFDGFSLDDKRDSQPDKNDLPEMLERWRKRDSKKDTNRTRKHFFVPIEDIRENKYDLSINRYKKIVYEEEKYDPPKKILDRMFILEKEIIGEMEDLREVLV